LDAVVVCLATDGGRGVSDYDGDRR
jgi:hypothetical protein